jgi:hypothetical protein
MLETYQPVKVTPVLEECCIKDCDHRGMVRCYACHELTCLQHMQKLPKSFKEGIVTMCEDCANRHRDASCSYS